MGRRNRLEMAWLSACTSTLCVFFSLALTGVAQAENWPQWRGPRGNSVSRERSIPIAWSEQRGLAWKIAIPQWGNSSPIVWNDSLFMTSQTYDGRLQLLHIGATTGRVLWVRTVGTEKTPREGPQRGKHYFHDLHNLASPSPVTNGEVVVAHFGNGDLAVYDYNGGQMWKRNLQQDYGPYTVGWGHANSPVIFGDTVVSVCLQDSLAGQSDEPAASYLVAHELATGKRRWKTPRMTGAAGEQGDAYTTPLLMMVNGQPRLFVMGGNQLDAYDPRTGRQIWFLPKQTGGRTVTSPTFANDHLFATRGESGTLFALKTGGKGELSRRDFLWTNSQGTPDSCSPLAHRTTLFTISDTGVARCFDTGTGKLYWKRRVPGQFKASPVWCGGRVLLLNTEGVCTVISAANQYSKLVENRLDAETIASPAIANGHIYIRGRKSLYCIGPSF